MSKLSMRGKIRALLLVLLLALVGTCAFVGVVVAVAMRARCLEPFLVTPWMWAASAACFLGVASVGVRWSMRGRPEAIVRMGEWMALVVLPVWGLAVNLALPPVGTCELGRPLAAPDVFGLFALYGGAVVAYFVARRRPNSLRPRGEAGLVVLLMAGIVVCSILTIHWVVFIPLGMLLVWVGLPLLAPLVALLMFLRVLVARLRMRGLEQRSEAMSLYAATAVLLGLWSVLQRLIFGRWPSAIVTETSGWHLSLLEPGSCGGGQHYLCTVAALGHRRLVRPERWGMRAGHRILVNRQLAVANAFEDLLHARWPRFGRWCREVYDHCALPVACRIRSALVCDLVYLLMKPFEMAFGLALLMFDPGDPEVRIHRMYRAPEDDSEQAPLW